MIFLDVLKEMVADRVLYYTVHAQEQMAIRRILDVEIREAILGQNAEIIEQYPEDKYSPSCLIYGITNNTRVLHVQANQQGVVITVYEPDQIKWDDNFKKRRR